MESEAVGVTTLGGDRRRAGHTVPPRLRYTPGWRQPETLDGLRARVVTEIDRCAGLRAALRNERACRNNLLIWAAIAGFVACIELLVLISVL